MKIIQIIKELNNTELGKGGTHETYIHVPQDLEVNDIFTKIDEIENFVYKKNGKIYNIRYTIGREKRIVGLGVFYRENTVSAGDEIVLERYINKNGDSTYYIDLNKKDNVLLVQRCKTGFEIITEDKKQLIIDSTRVYVSEKMKKIHMNFIGSEKKRADSPVETKIYDIKLDDVSIAKDYNKKDIIEIQVDSINNIAFINKVCAWKKYMFEMEEKYD